MLEERSAAMVQLREAQRLLQSLRTPSHSGTTADKHTGAASSTIATQQQQQQQQNTNMLSVFTFFFETDPVVQYTFPMRVYPLWTVLLQKRRVAEQSFAPSELYHEILSGRTAEVIPWVVVTSTHTTTSIVCHAEDLRSILLELIQNPINSHCVVDMNGLTLPSEGFWQQWEYRAALNSRHAAKLNYRDAPSALSRGPWRPQLAFPGELLRPLGASIKPK